MTRTYLIIGAIIVLLGLGAVIGWAVRGSCPEPIPPDTELLDSLRAASSRWEGQAKAFQGEALEQKKLRLAFERSRPSTSSRLNRLGNAIRSSGLDAAVDTLSVRPE